MSRRVTEGDELRNMINSFRCSDLVSLLGYVGRNRSGRKSELQLRALEILKNPPVDINLEAFKHKIKFLYKAAQDEAKQTHNLELQQQQMMPYNMPSTRVQQILPPQQSVQQQQRPTVGINHYVPSGPYSNQPQRYPGPMAVGVNPYQTSGFGQSIPPTPSAAVCNFTNAVLIPSNSYFSTHSDLKFRKLPFYNIKHEILKPTVLVSNHLPTLPSNLRTSATQEFNFPFVLSCDMASDMASNRDISNGKNEYNVQAQLRITATDNNSGNVTEYDDFLPLGLLVRLNQRQCTLPMCSPNSRSGTESRRIPRPINITPHMKMSPICANTLVINWACEQGKTFVATVNLVEKLSSENLLDKLKERPTISIDVTKTTIRQQYKRIDDDDDDNDENTNADDDDIATTIVRVSLVCPLAKFRMMYPAKGKNCTHLQCFDGSAYISLNEKRPMWMCPVCNRTLYFDDLLIDQYFLDVLQNADLSPDCQEVQLLVDGTWKSYDEETANNDEKSKNGSANSPSASSPKQEANNGDANDAGSSNEDVDKKDNAVIEENDGSGNAAASGAVVDLTEEDEESQDTAMETEANNVAKSPPVILEPPKISPPSPLSPAVANQDEANDKVEEGNSSTEKPPANTEDENSTVTTPTESALPAPPSEKASSTAVSSSGYVSPSIISLDSPSPPPMLNLNIGET